MGRKRIGCPVQKDGVWYAQLTVDHATGGTVIENFRLNDVRTKTEARAATTKLARAHAAAKIVSTRAVVPAAVGPVGLTFDAYLVRWIESRRLSGKTTSGKDSQRLTDHVLPLLKGKLMSEIEADPTLLRDVSAALVKRVEVARAGTDPTVKKFEGSTAKKVWEALTNLFATAANSNDKTLRILTTNPAKGIVGPRAGRKKKKQWVYPREFQRLIACREVPLAWREAYAVAIYLFLRVAELRALHCEDFDLDVGMVRVHRGTKKDRDGVGSERNFEIPSEIVPLIRILVARAGGKGPLFQLAEQRTLAKGRAAQRYTIGVGKQAERLREHLTVAGVTREALHRSTAQQSQQITFHDLRATGITWMALRGDTMIRIRDRAGHKDVNQTDDYVRRAGDVGDVGKPFPPLTALLSELAERGPSVRSVGSDIARDIARGESVESETRLKTGTSGGGAEGDRIPLPCSDRAETAEIRVDQSRKRTSKPSPRNIPRNIPDVERRGPTVQEAASVWALTCALEGLLAARRVAAPTRFHATEIRVVKRQRRGAA